MLRSFTTARALDYGMALEDMQKLEARVRSGADWVRVLECLGEDNLERARLQARRSRGASMSAFSLHAAACFRLAQSGAEEHPQQRLALYERQAAAFARGVAASGLVAQALVFSYRGSCHRGWYVRPDDAGSALPCVLVWGGADGWCEAFWPSVPAFLENGLAVCLLELPGQGLARLRDGSCLGTDFVQMAAMVMDTLATLGADASRFGVVGHSMGGTLAMFAAAADARIKACVNNGGAWQRAPDDPFPRVTQRVGRMLGPQAGAADVAAFYEAMDLPGSIRRMPAQLLCVQGGQDPLVPDQQAHQILEMRGSHAASLAYWPDGAHCVYNHALERNALVADWLAQVLFNAA